MGIYLADQALVFLQSLLVGAALGLLYDIFRVSRVAFYTSVPAVFAEDVIYFIICGLVTFFFGLTVIDGALRMFLIIGEFLGAVLYFFTLGKLVMGVAKKIIAAVKAIIRFIARWILRPIWLLFYHIVALILRPFAFLSRILKRFLRNTKFSLKIRRKVLYNQINTLLPKISCLKRNKEAKNGETRKEAR